MAWFRRLTKFRIYHYMLAVLLLALLIALGQFTAQAYRDYQRRVEHRMHKEYIRQWNASGHEDGIMRQIRHENREHSRERSAVPSPNPEMSSSDDRVGGQRGQKDEREKLKKPDPENVPRTGGSSTLPGPRIKRGETGT